MMRHLLLIQFFVWCFFASDAQQLAGLYHAQLNGDNVSLDLQQQSDGSYSGTMNDSYQTYSVLMELDGSSVSGVATESTLGLNFTITGTYKSKKLDLNFSFEYNGAKSSMDIAFTKEGGTVSGAQSGINPSPAQLSFPQGATHPAAIAGTWMKEELYQSGYGDNFMGAGFTQKMTFFPDGHIAEGASSSYMSGSYYSGQSYGDGDGVIPGIGWYTIGKTFYIQLVEEGKTRNIPLGTFYVEGNNMMITASSGDKLLLSRSN